LVKFGDAVVCANCKPLFVQRMREGTTGALGAVVYGGFWRRVVAQAVDSAVVFTMMTPLLVIFAGAMVWTMMKSSSSGAPNLSAIVPALLMFLGFLIVPFFYIVYFTTHGGATPGKMLMGIKIITASGGIVGTGRATGRVFARALSSAIFYIGDIMAGFDSQKRALHDRICDTRVIRIDTPLFGRRIGAFALDALIVGVVSYAVLIAWNLSHNIPFFDTSFNPNSPGAAFLQRFLKTWPATAFALGFAMVYSVYFTSQKGATPGKMAAGLKVVTTEGEPVGVGRAFARFLSVTFLSQYLTLGIGFTMAAFDKECRALEDRVCGTLVVRDALVDASLRSTAS
jgi:uncharacterized RDD family membrane protein YckC